MSSIVPPLSSVLRPRFSVFRRLLSLGLLAATLGAAASARAVTASEYDLKAAFLFNFILFTEWPAEALPPEGQPVVIGVLGEDPFGATLDRLVQNETIRRHPIVVKRWRDPGEIAGCHVLYVSRSESGRLPALLEPLRGKPVLTVSDIDRFAYIGGMIGLVVEQGRVRLQVNLHTATASRLALGAKLLHLALVIRDPPQTMFLPAPADRFEAPPRLAVESRRAPRGAPESPGGPGPGRVFKPGLSS